MASTLGAFPKLQDVGFYVEDLHNKYYDYPFNVNISYYGGMLHVSENTVPGLTLKTVCETFSGDTKVGARLNNNYVVITYFNARFYKLATAVYFTLRYISKVFSHSSEIEGASFASIVLR
jgi:hypothetical protein